MNVDTDRGYAIVHPNDVAHGYADSKVPGEFRRPTRSAASSPSRSPRSPHSDSGQARYSATVAVAV